MVDNPGDHESFRPEFKTKVCALKFELTRAIKRCEKQEEVRPALMLMGPSG